MKSKIIFIFKTFAILIVVLIISIFTYAYIKVNNIIKSLVSLDIEQIYAKESTKIYDSNLNLITELGIEKRDIVKYDEISDAMIKALIAIEDKSFFIHEGLDYKRILGALIENIKSQSYKEGASTLTQQLVKLSFLSNDKTIDRKVKEILISIELENRLTKREILEAYLNTVLFGGRIYGVEKASLYYFDKSASHLSYEEAALLAGMIQSPNRYNPYKNPEITKKRQIIVLNQMYENHFITKEELDKAINKPLNELVIQQRENADESKYHEYLDYVIYELINKYGLDPFNDSLRVITHLDPEIQKVVQDIENDAKLHPKDKTQAAIVVLETQTGFIRGIGGGKNYQRLLSFNYATDARLQPGSTIKPILDYGPSIEYLYYSPAQPYLDEKIYYNTYGSQFLPVYNYDRKYKGYLSMREAIIDSRNVTAIKAFREVGSARAYEFAHKLGLKTEEDITEAHAIGGYQYGFTVLQMAGAYAAFGNEGIYNEPTTINYIIKDNKEIPASQKSSQAMREDTAFLMSDILHDNMLSGTAIRANVKDLYIAGKTGQTNYDEETRNKFAFPSNSVRDSWFIGYTTKYTTAVWLGFSRIETDAYLTPDEAKQSLVMFKMVMDKIHKNRNDSQPFKKPDNIIEVEIETNTYPLRLPNQYTPLMYRKKEYFIEGTEPQEESTFFKPLPKPNNFFVVFDNNELIITWDKLENDYSHNDFKLMEEIHQIEDFYDYHKNKTQREFLRNQSPSFFNVPRISYLYNIYCKSSQSSQQCPILNNTLDSYLRLLDTLKQYEISLKTSSKNLNILSEGEISILRGYKTWNGYQNGIFSNLGSIEYTIIGQKYQENIILYRGPYTKQVTINMNLEEFLEYDAFMIYADFTKYRVKLQSSYNINLNPLFNIESFLNKNPL
ncbi:MAG TPA: PBP1A family penicillin-binding protein [Haloplasmataceae bacterium]